jgi:hypothetical protein
MHKPFGKHYHEDLDQHMPQCCFPYGLLRAVAWFIVYICNSLVSEARKYIVCLSPVKHRSGRWLESVTHLSSLFRCKLQMTRYSLLAPSHITKAALPSQ